MPGWAALAWVGSFGVGLTTLLFIASCLHFEYHSLQDIVGPNAFWLYPEQQDFWLYILSLIAVPAFTLIGYGFWATLATWLRRIQGQVRQIDIVFATLTFLVWWIRPLNYVAGNKEGGLPLYVVVGFFVAGNGVFVAYRWLQHRARSRSTETPPSLRLQGAIAVLGAGLGVSLLTSPLATPILDAALQTILRLSVGLWGCWLIGAYLLSRALHRSWQATAEALAVGILPLSVLPLQIVLWWEVHQADLLVAEYHSPAILLLPLVAVTACVFLTIWTLSRLRYGERPWGDVFWRWFLGLSVPLFLYAAWYNPNIHGPLDLFHEGERLSPAQALMAGQIPFRDVVWVHGFGRDPGVALAAFRLFGVSVAALRTLEQLLTPLVPVVNYYLAWACLGRRWALLSGLLGLTLAWPMSLGWGNVPVIVTILCLVLYLRRRHLVWAVAGGLATFGALVVSFSEGMVALAVGLALVATFTLANWRETKWTLALDYVLPIGFGLGGAALYLASVGALAQAVVWHKHLMTALSDLSGMPFPFPPGSFSQAWETLLSPLASIIAALILLMALVRKQWSISHWIALLLLAANVALFNRGVIKGWDSAADWGLFIASQFALLLLLVAWRSVIVRKRFLELSLTAVLGLTLFLPPMTRPMEGQSLIEIVDGLPQRNRIEIPTSWVNSGIKRIGSIFLPPEQADSLTEIADLVAQDSFLDFTDHVSLYFLTGSSSPTRFQAMHHVITRENQLEVIHDLATSPPRYVLYRSGTGWDALAGVDRTLRSFLVSEYVLRHYHLAGQAGGFTVLEKGPPTTAQDLRFRVDLGYIPVLWGRDRIDDLTALGIAAQATWHFSTEDLEDWEPILDVSTSEPKDGAWHLQTSGPDPQVQNLALNIDPQSVTYVGLSMRVTTEDEKDVRAQLFWRSGQDGYAEDKSVVFDVVADGQPHLYLLRVASFPSWTWSQPITGLRLDPADSADLPVFIDSIELLQVHEFDQ